MTSSEYRLPALPLGRPEVTLLRWLKQPGEQVVATDALALVANDRLEVVLPAGQAGVLGRQHVGEGAEASAGMLLAMFTTLQQHAPPRSAGPPLRATPVARRIAADCGIALEHLAGSGASGRVTKADVLAARAIGASATAQLPEQDHPPFAPLIAALPQPARLQQLPETHALSAFEVDLERVAAVCARLSADWARHGLACTEIVCVIAAVVAALPAHPLLNATWRDEDMLLRRQIDLALLRDAGPAFVPSAQDLNLRGLARALGRGSESATDCSTFTIIESRVPAWSILPMLNLRQSATLGVGAAQARAVVVEERGAERIAVRRIAVLTLAYDARMFDQAYADAFLRDLKARLEMFDT